MGTKKGKGNVSQVVGTNGLKKKQAELESKGYSVLYPGHYITGNERQETTWNDFIHAQLQTASSAFDGGNGGKHRVATAFSSSGQEHKGGVDNIGTKDLGWMDWGAGNNIPNVVSLLSSILSYTAAGWKFNNDLCIGRGPEPMYHYTQYVGGNITEKDIPYLSADKLIRGLIIDKQRELRNISPSNDLSFSENSDFNVDDDEDIKRTLKEEISELQKDLEQWKTTSEELREFLNNNNLKHVYLSLSGDMQMLWMCFPEILLNQQAIDDKGNPVDSKTWKPKAVGLSYRPAHSCRLERMDKDNRINYVYVSNSWMDQPFVTSNGTDASFAAYPALSPTSPVADLQKAVREARQSNVSKEERPTRFIFPSYYPTVGRPYYPVPSWHSIFSGDIYEYLSTIISDRYNRKKNSNIIGRIIYIHNAFLQQLFVQEKVGSNTAKQDEIRDKLYKEINTWLGNRDNSGQSLIAFTFIGTDGKEHKSFEIVEVESSSKDSVAANEKETAEVSSIIFMSMGLDSQLLGSSPLSLLGKGGGTDLRERYLLKQIQMSPTQQILLQALEVVSRFNEWDDHLRWQIGREVMTTLDRSKTGITKQEEE